MKKLFLMLAAASLTTACSIPAGPSLSALTEGPSVTEPQDDEIVQKLTGKPVSYVQEKLGLPNRRSDLPTGAMIWTYTDNEKGLDANECKVALSIRDGVVQRVSISTKSASLFSAVSNSCVRIRNHLS